MEYWISTDSTAISAWHYRVKMAFQPLLIRHGLHQDCKVLYMMLQHYPLHTGVFKIKKPTESNRFVTGFGSRIDFPGSSSYSSFAENVIIIRAGQKRAPE